MGSKDELPLATFLQQVAKKKKKKKKKNPKDKLLWKMSFCLFPTKKLLSKVPNPFLQKLPKWTGLINYY
jgi:hypothetical protein